MIKTALEVGLWVVVVCIGSTVVSVTAKSIRDLWRKK